MHRKLQTIPEADQGLGTGPDRGYAEKETGIGIE